MEIGLAVDRAITDMPADYVIKPFLESHRAEVMGMMLMEYNEAETMNMFKEEGREEGLKKGRKEGRKEGREELASLMYFLLQEGRIEDVKRVTSDPDFQNQLLQEYNRTQKC